VQPLRRWVPASAGDLARASTQSNDGPLEKLSPKDMAFCAELAFNGGVAVSEEGFKAEAELLRMRQAGLLDLQRDQAPPFAVTRVALSDKARALLSGKGRTTTNRDRTRVAENAARAASSSDPGQGQTLRRNGFEVARGMINAAVKSEIASWNAKGRPGGYGTLETHILARISRIETPFPG
jgi:hypothetical protein